MRATAICLLLLPILVLAAMACGGEETEPAAVPTATQAAATPSPQAGTGATAQPATVAPPDTPVPAEATRTPAPTATTPPTAPPTTNPGPAPTDTPTPPSPPTGSGDAPTPESTPTPLPTATPEPAPTEAGAGPDSFIVGEGSQITFTVEEELNFSPVRFDAVISGTGLSGFANLDGSPSEIALDLHSLESDQSFRDRYIRQRMFPNTPTATVIVDDLPDLPQSFFEGEETSGTLDGSLQIGDTVTPLTFDVTARHDGDVINVLGKTTFTWDGLGLSTPIAGPVVFLADEVRVQVLIIAHAQ